MFDYDILTTCIDYCIPAIIFAKKKKHQINKAVYDVNKISLFTPHFQSAPN